MGGADGAAGLRGPPLGVLFRTGPQWGLQQTTRIWASSLMQGMLLWANPDCLLWSVIFTHCLCRAFALPLHCSPVQSCPCFLIQAAICS